MRSKTITSQFKMPRNVNENAILFKNIEESIHDSYRLCFQIDRTYNIRASVRENNQSPFLPPHCIEDNIDLAFSCVAILDMCLKSEKEYPMTFWIELIRCIESDDLELKNNMGTGRIFNAFIGYLISFNKKYGDAIPRVALSNYQMHRAARFSCSRLNNDTDLIKQMFKTYLLVEEDDVLSDGELHPECDLGFLDDL